jgi:hypothetical protein
LKSDLDGVDVRIPDEECEDGETDPRRGAWRDTHECDKEWETPDLSDGTDIQPRIEFLTQPCPKQNLPGSTPDLKKEGVYLNNEDD